MIVEERATPATARRTTIVLADDHRIVRSSLRFLLEADEEFEVVAEAGEVEEAVRKVRAYKPQVLVLDLGMPGIDGYEVIRRVKEMPGTADMLVVALTGWGQAEDRRRTAEAGFDCHVVKPLESKTLAELLAKLDASVL